MGEKIGEILMRALLVVFIFGALYFALSAIGSEEKTTTRPTSKGGEVITSNGVFTQKKELNEFDYKGHTYISCKVRDGIALTHAGHCWCNKK